MRALREMRQQIIYGDILLGHFRVFHAKNPIENCLAQSDDNPMELIILIILKLGFVNENTMKNRFSKRLKVWDIAKEGTGECRKYNVSLM